jgi:hypothetical protein
MTQSKNIFGRLLILLLILFSNYKVLPSTHNAADFHDKSSISNKINEKNIVLLSKHSIPKDWIKVRFKGGEIPIFSIATLIHFAPIKIAERIKGLNYVPFVSLNYDFSFKLRGPPAGLS